MTNPIEFGRKCRRNQEKLDEIAKILKCPPPEVFKILYKHLDKTKKICQILEKLDPVGDDIFVLSKKMEKIEKENNL